MFAELPSSCEVPDHSAKLSQDSLDFQYLRPCPAPAAKYINIEASTVAHVKVVPVGRNIHGSSQAEPTYSLRRRDCISHRVHAPAWSAMLGSLQARPAPSAASQRRPSRRGSEVSRQHSRSSFRLDASLSRAELRSWPLSLGVGVDRLALAHAIFALQETSAAKTRFRRQLEEPRSRSHPRASSTSSHPSGAAALPRSSGSTSSSMFHRNLSITGVSRSS